MNNVHYEGINFNEKDKFTNIFLNKNKIDDRLITVYIKYLVISWFSKDEIIFAYSSIPG